MNELLRWRKDSRKIDPHLWEQLAALVGTSPGYLNLIAYDKRNPSVDRAKAIEAATKQFTKVKPVTKESLLF
ncbi:helix-turn-helix domain-containing protein [Atlantibacter subterranea]|uniref:helix-turn-helix domain-containing protein n=1 Tax=Atlantibacter subterraneus TaxID=255519 RepID=UPI0020C54C23|nr:helix-turn-helix transcriptional regulator [Atlantibacter subterranea]UTJ46621.1 helix-turn-helix domain-containing protein [Atlantibacter subterranea]